MSYQQENLNLAKTLLNELKTMGWGSINTYKAISQFNIPGRFQTIQEEPKIIVDVAHNQSGFETLFAQKEILEASQLHILFGGTKEKDLVELLSLFPVNAKINFSSFSNSRSLSKVDFEVQNEVSVYQYYDNPIDAFNEIVGTMNPNETLLICGSFYLISDLKPLLNLQS
jgi:dihydrofolate synthase/folylpolyglutamate synthase